jgi:hypothetical protein
VEPSYKILDIGETVSLEQLQEQHIASELLAVLEGGAYTPQASQYHISWRDETLPIVLRTDWETSSPITSDLWGLMLPRVCTDIALLVAQGDTNLDGGLLKSCDGVGTFCKNVSSDSVTAHLELSRLADYSVTSSEDRSKITLIFSIDLRIVPN